MGRLTATMCAPKEVTKPTKPRIRAYQRRGCTAALAERSAAWLGVSMGFPRLSRAERRVRCLRAQRQRLLVAGVRLGVDPGGEGIQRRARASHDHVGLGTARSAKEIASDDLRAPPLQSLPIRLEIL